jgi:hypothetical protein
VVVLAEESAKVVKPQANLFSLGTLTPLASSRPILARPSLLGAVDLGTSHLSLSFQLIMALI